MWCFYLTDADLTETFRYLFNNYYEIIVLIIFLIFLLFISFYIIKFISVFSFYFESFLYQLFKDI